MKNPARAARGASKTERPGPRIEIAVESARWKRRPQAARLIRRAIAAAAPASLRRAELSVVLTHDRAIRVLNREWRGQDKPTNVLSFPAAARLPGGPRLMGDIVIAFETTAAEAKAQDKPFDHHLVHLAVHGFLHLLGYDHESNSDAEAMERRERRILSRLDIPDPYTVGDADP